MKKRIISMALALVMMLSLCVITVSAEETEEAANLVYYDLKEQDKANYVTTTTGFADGKSGYDKTAGGFVSRDTWARINVTSGKLLELISSETEGKAPSNYYLLNYFGLRTAQLKDGDYSVPLRKVTMGFKTSTAYAPLYDQAIKLWYNLYAVSAEGLRTMNTAGCALTDEMLAVVNELEDDDLVLFFWGSPSSIRSYWTSKDEYKTPLYPIAKIGTVGQTDYVNIEYVYEPKSNGTLIVSGLKINGSPMSTLIDETTALAGLTFKETGYTQFYAYNMRPDFTSTSTNDTAAVIVTPTNLISENGTYKRKKTTLTFNALKYEGIDPDIELSETAPAVAENTLSTTVTVANDTYAPLSGNIIFAAYSGNVLVGVDIEPVSVGAEGSATESKDLSITNEAIGGDGEITYKVMLLDSISKLIPLVSANDGTVAK